ncbi:P-loop NTPase fold protein [Pedobacter sp. KACC 23697]|uniref:P-loop NTPase fold protein n=1 Tax=Pedobacter sp. KACC 23697 TaxID=3149230 RepID=A0AAU7K1E9_9SPHI
METYDILCIYNENEIRVNEIVEAIKLRGYKTFFWRTDVEIGEHFTGREHYVLENTKSVLVFLGSFGWGPNHLALTEEAIKTESNVIPIKIGDFPDGDDLEASGLFLEKRYVEMSIPKRKDYLKLFERLGPRVKNVSIESFDKFIEKFLRASDKEQDISLASVSKLGSNEKRILSSNVILRLKDLESDELPESDETRLGRHVIWCGLFSLLIASDPHSYKAKELIINHLSYNVAHSHNVAVWILAELYHSNVPYLNQAAEAALRRKSGDVRYLAKAILGPDEELINEFDLILRGEDQEQIKGVLDILEIYAIPYLFPAMLKLFHQVKLIPDVLRALANLELDEYSDHVLDLFSVTDLLGLFYQSYLVSPDIDLNSVIRLLTLYPDEYIEDAKNKLPQDEEARDFVDLIKGCFENRNEEENAYIGSGYTSDRSDVALDYLGIDKDVSTLSALMLSRQVSPPLAIGLFGGWGTGKSFFMESLQSRCKTLILEQKKNKKTAFHTNIVQITFNAWNYSDSNLWASLVHHIFESLSYFLNPAETQEQKLKQLTLEVADNEAEQRKYEKLIEDEKKKIDEKTEQLGKLSQEREKRNIAFSELSRDDYEKILTVEQKQAAKKIVDDLGLTELNSSVTDLENALKEAETTKGRILNVASWFFSKDHWLLKGFIFAMILVIIPVACFIIREYHPNIWTSVVGFFVWSAGAIGGLVLLIKTALKHINSSLSVIEEMKTNIDAVIKSKRETPTVQETELSQEITQLKDQKDTNEKMAGALQLKAEASKKSKAEFITKISLSSFIADRAISSDYLEHLGIVTRIRKDFQYLIDKIQNSQHLIKGKKVERIILYIDDLDRCPPAKVFEVLQAVNLLLAYELFVVVVGVDTAWMTKSLSVTLEQLHENNGEKISPLNFIEKIFQIPYNLKPLSVNSFPNLLKGLFTPPLKKGIRMQESTPTLQQQENKDFSEKENDPGINHIATAIEYREASIDAKSENQKQDTTQAEITTSHSNYESIAAEEKEKRSREVTKNFHIEEAALEIKDWESEFAGKLFEFISTPRAAKRFVNIYRLMKVGISKNELTEFEGVSGNPGDFQCPMLLLAIIVGCPNEAPNLLANLYKEALQGRNIAQGLDQILNEEIAQEIMGFPVKIRRIIDDLWFRDTSALLLKWIPEVSRFSFREIKL